MKRAGRWLLAGAPLLVGVVVAILVAVELLPRPVLYLRADLGTFALLLGGLLSLGVLVPLWVYYRGRQRQQMVRHEAQEEAAAERRRFLRRLDHELKNPLTAIRAALVNLADPNAPPVQREALSSVENQALRLSRLAADLRKLAELETRPLERSPVQLDELLQEVSELALERPEADGRIIHLNVPQAPWPLPPVAGDADLLFLAVHNLVDNALKFTRPGDTIEIRALEDGTQVLVEVADTGPGVPAEEIGQIWDELYRGQGARGISGSGLGLALVRAIAERHDGEVSVRSRSGQGTVFALRLPLR